MTLWKKAEYVNGERQTDAFGVDLGGLGREFNEKKKDGFHPIDFLEQVDASMDELLTSRDVVGNDEFDDNFNACLRQLAEGVKSSNSHLRKHFERFEERAHQMEEFLGEDDLAVAAANKFRCMIALAFALGHDLGEKVGFLKGLSIPYLDASVAHRAGIARRNGGMHTRILRNEEDRALFAMEHAKHGNRWKKIAAEMSRHGRTMTAKTAARYAKKLAEVDNASDV